MKNLVIVESPSKSKTIEKYLGKDYEVVSSKGHIRDLAIKGKDGLGIDIDNDFTPTYVIAKGKKDVVASLKDKASKADKVYLATDPDREGEAISWHLAKEAVNSFLSSLNLTSMFQYSSLTKRLISFSFSTINFKATL